MSNAGTFKKRIFPVLFMLIVTLVFISVTTFIYTFSKDTIKFNEALRLRRAVLYASGVPLPEQPQEIEQLYSERVEEVTEGGNVKYYLVHGDDPSTVASYVVVTRGPGLWGEITVAIGYDESGKQVSGLEVIDQNETPGLGGRIGEEWFKSQFRGKQYPLSMVSEGTQAGNDEFEAITGASYSSAAIRDIVNSTSDALLSSIR